MALWRRVLLSLGCVAAPAAVLFASAGRLDVASFWAYVGVNAAAFVAGLVLVDADLWQERMRPGGARPPLIYAPLALPVLAQWLAAGLDLGRLRLARPVPAALRAAALAALAAAFALSLWAARVNRNLSSVVRIQHDRGHRIVTTGPYAWIRHPTYLAALLLLVASGLALGSWVAAPITLLYLPPLAYRTITEDRFLQAHLEGYADYARRVPHRLIPGLW